MKLASLRWWIAAVLMAASVLNYLDRVALGVASAPIRDELGLSATQYALIVNAFLAAYTLSYGFGGMLVDRLGTRRSVVLTLVWWSLANMAHALAATQAHLMVCRFLLGLGEATFYPAAIRCAAEWFPPRERSKCVGMILAGASLGATLAPPLVAGMIAVPGIGWRGAFLVTGALGFLLLPAWLVLYRRPEEHPMLTPSEREYLEAHRPPAAAAARPWPVRAVMAHRQAWVVLAARMLTDAAWYLLLFWLILYLQKGRGFTPGMVAAYGWIPYAAADLGALCGGWASSTLIRRGWSVVRARTRCMAAFAMLLPACLAGYFAPAEAPWLAVLLISVATFGHMAWGTNSLTLHSDLFPTHTVATFMGITGAAGSIGGIVAQQAVGALVDLSGTYLPVFVAAACCHPVAAVVLLVGLRSAAPLPEPGVPQR